MRIILFTGKGGVGKTSIAAASALRASEMGYKTIVLSTDAAHSLSDSLDIPMGPEPTLVKENLWGQETEIYHTMETHWGDISRFISALLAWRGMDSIVADEVAVLPGMEELANLLYIARYQEEGKFDVVIVDCAPTGETLRLLSFPEMLQWWMSHMFPIQRKLVGAIRPMVGALTKAPVPTNEVFDAIGELYNELYKIHTALGDADISSVRLVVNPEKMVIKEAQRTLTYLNLFGYYTDAIVCNRIIPNKVADSYFKTWKTSQRKYHRLIEEGFSPLPILDMPLLEREVVGLIMLEKMAQNIYGQEDPSRIYYKGRTQDIRKENGRYVLTLELPFTSKDKISLTQGRDELDIKVASYRRNIILPHLLRGLSVSGARFEENRLKISFGSDTTKKSGKDQ
jgi:arsenite-transporting ATPase